MRHRFARIAAYVVLAGGPSAWGGVRYVPSDAYPYIQGAIDDSGNGDLVVILPGTHWGSQNINLDFQGKAITVRSTDPNDPNVVAATEIWCVSGSGGLRRAFNFHSGEGPDSVVDGLTIRDAYHETSSGAGILCHQSSPTIRNCRIIDCTIAYKGSPDTGCGAGIASFGGNPTIENCLISGNRTLGNYGRGAGIYLSGGETVQNWPTIRNCTIVGNTAGIDGGGIRAEIWGHPKVSNCIVRDNVGGQIVSTTSITVTYSDVEGGFTGDGNTDVDPMFIDPNGPDGDPNTWEDNDYHLSPNSPCVDAGDPNGDYTGQLDVDAQVRENGVVDMGSDEVWPDLQYAFDLEVFSTAFGDVSVSPEPQDANQPQYRAGSVVILTAEPVEDAVWRGWQIFDPNHPGDANYAAVDTNNPLTLVMDSDKEIHTAFRLHYNCGWGTEAMLPMTLAGLLGLCAVARRRR